MPPAPSFSTTLKCEMVWPIMVSPILGVMGTGTHYSGLQRWFVQTGLTDRFSPVCLWGLSRSQQSKKVRSFAIVTRFRKRLLFKRDVLAAHRDRADQCRQDRPIRLPEQIAAHHAPATHRNPDS